MKIINGKQFNIAKVNVNEDTCSKCVYQSKFDSEASSVCRHCLIDLSEFEYYVEEKKDDVKWLDIISD